MMKKIFVFILLSGICLSALGTIPSHAVVRKMKARPARKVVLPPAPREIAPPPVTAPVIVTTPTPPRAKRDLSTGPAIGLSGGLFGNIPSLSGDIWFHKFMGIEGTAVKAGLRYAQGKDSGDVTRKDLLVFSDGIWNLNGGPGAILYIGAGVNYLAYTTGQTSGTIGGEAYLGIQEGTTALGSLYFEAGYGAIRSGFSPTIKGLNVSLGYKAGI